MPMDGITMHALKSEFCRHIGARLDRITQPERDEVVLYFYTKGENRRLLLSANASHPRVQWIGYPKENPAYAPNFCMLLRKHLIGARLLSVDQPGFERVLIFSFECKNDFYEVVEKRLIIELAGRTGNIILTDGNGKIYDALRQADLASGLSRRILPGVTYELPPSQNKTRLTEDCTVPLPDSDGKADRLLTARFEGFSPLLSREISFRVFGSCDPEISSLPADWHERLESELARWREKIENDSYEPCVLLLNGEAKDFSCFPITQYGAAGEILPFATCCEAMDFYYVKKDEREHIRRHSGDIAKLLSTTLSRLNRKIEAQRAELADANKADRYRLYGDLIVSNLYRFRGHESQVVLPDYTQDLPADVKISLNPAWTASRNAQAYYKKYKKAQNAKTILQAQIDAATAEVAYLTSVEDSLSRARESAELEDLRSELIGQGYLRRKQVGKKVPPERIRSRPIRFVSDDGFEILCGRNNLQNDFLTLHAAGKRDIWFHVKNSPGSHTVLLCGGNDPSDLAMTQAAVIAATNSSVRESDNVAVDYTEIRYVRKPAGAKPGAVIYDPYRTAYVDPNPDLCEKLRKK